MRGENNHIYFWQWSITKTTSGSKITTSPMQGLWIDTGKETWPNHVPAQHNYDFIETTEELLSILKSRWQRKYYRLFCQHAI
jgi:hypothetical protein